MQVCTNSLKCFFEGFSEFLFHMFRSSHFRKLKPYTKKNYVPPISKKDKRTHILGGTALEAKIMTTSQMAMGQVIWVRFWTIQWLSIFWAETIHVVGVTFWPVESWVSFKTYKQTILIPATSIGIDPPHFWRMEDNFRLNTGHVLSIFKIDYLCMGQNQQKSNKTDPLVN